MKWGSVEFRDYLAVIRKYIISIIIITILGVAGGAAYALLTPPTYTASASVYLFVSGGGSTSDMVQGTTYATNQARSFAEIAATPKVLDPVISRLDLDETAASLADSVTTSIPTNTSLIDISAKSGDAKQAADIAQAVAESLVDQIEAISGTAADAKALFEGTIVTPAQVPTAPSSPKLLQSLALGAVAGLVIGFGQALLRKAMDIRFHNSDDLMAATDYPILSTVPLDLALQRNPLMMLTAPSSVTGERYRQLSTNLRFFFIDSDKPKTFAITSSVESEGKTVTSINTAYALAEGGDRVLLIDSDLRRPKVANYLALEESVGLATVLLDHVPLYNVVQSLGKGAPDVLATGTVMMNPAGLIGSRRMQQLIEQVSREYDVVVIDTAPVLPVADTLALLPFVSATLVVVSADQVTAPQLAQTIESIERTGSTNIGMVLNREKRKASSSYYNYTNESDSKRQRSSSGHTGSNHHRPEPKRSA
ncbi:MAG: polysaccharide biosynthesis tyrosine autokinase [Propionibacteriaceae bacterium]|jgi:capsular exopolysaccharide synthesis family protein|nr:polysaccharide biosynthesis tyrosine autokinase [Propionibacteriaceae bacterium]